MGVSTRAVQERCLVRMYPSGKLVDPFNLKLEDIEIKDIAHHLARICRWNGGVPGFYSVAEHSIAVAKRCSKKNQLWALLHDAAEAYIGDIVRPLKASLMYVDPDAANIVMNSIELLEERILFAIACKFDLLHDLPEEVKKSDDLRLEEERQLIESGIEFGNYPNIAAARFLAVFNQLTKVEEQQ